MDNDEVKELAVVELGINFLLWVLETRYSKNLSDKEFLELLDEKTVAFAIQLGWDQSVST